MANTATLIDTIPKKLQNRGLFYEYEVVIDTINTDLDVRTPSASNRVFVKGIWLCEGTALNLTFKSGSSKSHTFEIAANQGLPGFTEKGFFFATKPGEKLTVSSSAAIGSTVGKNFVLRVTEGVACDED